MKEKLSSQITPYKIYLSRRQFIKSSIASSLTTLIPSNLHAFHKTENLDYYNKLDYNDF